MPEEIVPEWNLKEHDAEIRVAKAIYGVGVAAARAHTESLELPIERITKALDRACAEADRSSAILIFALCEDLMLDAFKRYLSLPPKGQWDDVTGGNGLLATANDRLTLCSMLGWIPPLIYQDLRVLKSIRNRFAHHADAEDFDDPTIRSWIANLRSSEKGVFERFPQLIGDQKLSSRQSFLIRAAMVVTTLVEHLSIAPVAKVERVDPRDVRGEVWETVPTNIKSLVMISAGMVLKVCAAEGDKTLMDLDGPRPTS